MFIPLSLFLFYFQEYIYTLFLSSLHLPPFWKGRMRMKKKGLGKKLMDSVWKVLLAPNHTSSLFISILSLIYSFLLLFLFSFISPFSHLDSSSSIKSSQRKLSDESIYSSTGQKATLKHDLQIQPPFQFPLFFSFNASIYPTKSHSLLPVNAIIADFKSDRLDDPPMKKGPPYSVYNLSYSKK